MTHPRERWRTDALERRSVMRAEYRRTPALLELEGCRCAVRDLGPGGLRVEPAPAGRVWYVGQQVTGTLVLRAAARVAIHARIARLDPSGFALLADGAWPTAAEIEAERAALLQRGRERRAAPRLRLGAAAPDASGTRTPLRDVSTTGLRYQLTRFESAPAVGSRIEGALRLGAEAVIEVRGRVIRHVGREIAVIFDPPGLDPEVLASLQERFFPR